MKPILFNTEMVRAILDGRKTQTRRVCKALENYDFSWGLDRKPYIGDYKTFTKVAPRKWDNVTLENVWLYDLQTAVDESKTYVLKPSYQPGDILWVRETWRDRWGMAYANYGTGNAYPIDDVREIEYKAGGNGFFMHGCNLCPDEPTVKWGEWSKWRPSIYMPREAARIFLRVTNVRVERLQDITIKDIRSEGTALKKIEEPEVSNEAYLQFEFQTLWNSTVRKKDIDKYGWNANPWVWVYEFERVSEDGSSKDE